MKKIIFILLLSICFQHIQGGILDSPEFSFEEENLQWKDEESDEIQNKKFTEQITLSFYDAFNNVKILSNSTESINCSYHFLDEKISHALNAIPKNDIFYTSRILCLLAQGVKAVKCKPLSSLELLRDTTSVQITFFLSFEFGRHTHKLTVSSPITNRKIKFKLSYSDSLNLMHEEKNVFVRDILLKKLPSLFTDLIGLQVTRFNVDLIKNLRI